MHVQLTQARKCLPEFGESMRHRGLTNQINYPKKSPNVWYGTKSAKTIPFPSRRDHGAILKSSCRFFASTKHSSAQGLDTARGLGPQHPSRSKTSDPQRMLPFLTFAQSSPLSQSSSTSDGFFSLPFDRTQPWRRRGVGFPQTRSGYINASHRS